MGQWGQENGLKAIVAGDPPTGRSRTTRGVSLTALQASKCPSPFAEGLLH